MSRAFVKEREEDVLALPDRLVSNHPNFVTEAGRNAIEAALQQYEFEHKSALESGDASAAASALREVRYWKARLATAQIVKPTADRNTVHFGQEVTIRRANGQVQTFRIVGEDEADPANGSISHAAPIARELVGRAVGESIEIGGQDAIIVKISL